MRRLIAPALCLLWSCGQDPSPAPGSDGFVRPTAVAEISLGLSEQALPETLASGPLFLASAPGVSTLIGGAAGLYEIGSEGLRQIDDRPVTGMVHYAPVGIVVAHGAAVSIWNGALAPSQLADALEGATISALSAQGDTLWIGTSAGLHRFEAGALEGYQAMATPIGIYAYAGGRDVVVEKDDGEQEVIRDLGGHQERQLIDAEAIVPGAGDRLYALHAGALEERVGLEGELAAFLPLTLSIDAEAGATGISALSVDATTGFVWGVGAGLFRLENGRVSTLPRPPLGTLRLMTATTDGALWLADEATLVRVGNEGPPVTWAENVSTFHENNCQRCHAPFGVAHDLGGVAKWTTEIDQIIDEVGSGRMPQDKQALVGGSVELLRRWRADGLRP